MGVINMKKKLILLIVLVGVVVLGLVGCGGVFINIVFKEDKVIKIGVILKLYKEIVDIVKLLFEKEGYIVEVIEFNDYV